MIEPTTPRQEFFRGVRAELPILVGSLPFGMICGALASAANFSFLQAQAMSLIILAGASQLVLTQLYQIFTPGLVILMTVAVVNLRHLLYSASLAPFFHKLDWRWKSFLAYLMTDGAYAVTILHCQQVYQADPIGEEIIPNPSHPRQFFHWFYLGAALSMWVVWQVSATAGILLGAIIPASWSLDFSMSLSFIALVAANIKDRASLAAALSAGVTGVVAYGLPYKTGLALAAFVGITTGTLLETYLRRRAPLVQKSAG